MDGLILSSDKFLRLRLTVLFLYLYFVYFFTVYVNICLCTFDDWRCIFQKNDAIIEVENRKIL